MIKKEGKLTDKDKLKPQNNYNFFKDGLKCYEIILKKYRENTSSVKFSDPYFRPIFKFKGIKWKRIDDIYKAPLFDQKIIHPSFIGQGKIGDCYFISALSRVASQPILVRYLFETKLPNEYLGVVPNSINIKCGAVVRIQILNQDYIQNLFIVFLDIIILIFSYSQIKQKCTESQLKLEKVRFTERILKYEKHGCIMDSSIQLDRLENITEQNIKKIGLSDTHSYLLLKTVKVDGNTYFLLRNPHGKIEWRGQFSEGSPCWTPELKMHLRDTISYKKGFFLLTEDEFFKYFTLVNVSKPFKLNWYVRYITFSLLPSPATIPNKIEEMDLPNFIFKVKEKIPSEQKSKFRILIEKRFSEFVPNKERILSYITIAFSNGQKLTSDLKDKSEFFRTIPFDRFFYLSLPLLINNSIITFIIHYKTTTNLTQNFFIRVFCENDFDLYDFDKPNYLYPKEDTQFPIMSNFSLLDPNKNLTLHSRFVNGREVLCFDEPNSHDFDPNHNQEIEKIIIKNRHSPIFVHLNQIGPQLDISLFTYIKQTKVGRFLIVNEAKENETGKKVNVLWNRHDYVQIKNRFVEEVSIRQKLDHCSIVKFIGYTQKDFQNKDHPMLFTEFYSKGSLLELLQSEDCGFLDYEQKKIILIGVAHAMQFIHSKKIIHFDLKCSSVYLDDHFNPKVGDFGCARYSDSEHRKIDERDPKYLIAPELIKGNNCSFPVDVFAYGMLFYHVISNKIPMIQCNNILDLNIQILNGARPDLSCIPPIFHCFLNSLWSQKAEDRLSFNQIVDFWDSLQEDVESIRKFLKK